MTAISTEVEIRTLVGLPLRICSWEMISYAQRKVTGIADLEKR